MTRKSKNPEPAGERRGVRERDRAGRPINPNNIARSSLQQQPQPSLTEGDLVVFLPTEAHYAALLDVIGEVVARGQREGWLAGADIKVVRVPPRRRSR